MKYLLTRNDNPTDTTDGWPVGVVKDISQWKEYQNIRIYEINRDGTIGKIIKCYGEGKLFTDGISAYRDGGIEWVYIKDLPQDMTKFFGY